MANDAESGASKLPFPCQPCQTSFSIRESFPQLHPTSLLGWIWQSPWKHGRPAGNNVVHVIVKWLLGGPQEFWDRKDLKVLSKPQVRGQGLFVVLCVYLFCLCVCLFVCLFVCVFVCVC